MPLLSLPPLLKQTAHLKPGLADVARDPCLDASASVAALAAACTSISGHNLRYEQQELAVQQDSIFIAFSGAQVPDPDQTK